MVSWGSYDTEKNKIQINAKLFEKYQELDNLDISKTPFRNQDHLWIFDVLLKVQKKLINLLKGTKYVVAIFSKNQNKVYLKCYGGNKIKESLGFSDEELSKKLHDKFYKNILEAVYAKEVK